MADRIPSDQFAEILRVVRETVREEMRAEFEGRRVASSPAYGPPKLEYVFAAGKPGCTDSFSVLCAESRQRLREEELASEMKGG